MDRSLFPDQDPAERTVSSSAPLADRMRPLSLDELVGQEHILGPERVLRDIIRSRNIPSMIFWGPPGVGKTTLAYLLARETDCRFASLSAVLAGVKNVKKVVEEAEFERRRDERPTVLFVDEIHRFNKAQQDAFLPHVERGTIILVGATTENPSFEVIAPLLSRSRVLVLKALKDEHILQILERTLQDRERGLGNWNLSADPKILVQLAAFANGDARVALNSLELAAQLARTRHYKRPRLTAEILEEALQKRTILYDKAGEEHFNLISALHKSLRNSDVDASLYWMGRMLEAGEDAMYIARRLVRFASEDVGIADPAALGYAIDAMQAVHFIGLPEGKLALGQITVYLAQAPKSNALYRAYAEVAEDVAKTRNEPVPLQLRNASTQLMKDLDYGKGYRYAHQEPDRVADMQCLPENLADRRYYRPTSEGFEKEVAERLRTLERLKKEQKS